METKGNGKFYITTPIYYPNDRLHIGHAYTTTLADSLARYNRMAGRDVLFLTGSDEHGQKLQRAAEERGQSPKEYVDVIVSTFQELWRRLDISYDDFIRTTDPRHVKVVQEIFEKVYAKGDIYKGQYEGWYCTPDEAFWLERQLVDGKCPQCGRPVERVREESYFFRLSNYQNRLVDHIRSHPEFIQPESRRNEVLKFIEQGLDDLSISRTSFDWGIPIPRDPKHVIYVWFDALSNYLTGAGYLQDEAKFQKFWPADLHLVGKEITRFHCIIWPAMLMALDLPLPKTVFGHGWLVMGGDKMSKSKGNVVDPMALIDEFGADALRYFLLREISFGSDGNFSREAFIQRINSDLANDLGNLIYRTSSMLQRYFGGRVPAPGDPDEIDRSLASMSMETVNKYREQMDIYDLNAALSSIWHLVGRANKYIDEKAPWNLAKHEEDQPRLARVMYNLVEVIRMVDLMIFPFMPATGRKIWAQLSLPGEIETVGLAACSWGRLPVGVEVKHEEPLFPRIEVKAEETPANLPSQPEKPQAQKAQPAQAQTQATQPSATKEEGAGLISIDDFGKVDLRVGTIRQAERIQGADKLLKLKVDLGEDRERQIVAGIALHYDPEDLPGQQVVVVSNLKPAKLRGELSEGMLLAASTPDKSQVILVAPHNPIAPGSRVK